jgi:hypothetical protein
MITCLGEDAQGNELLLLGLSEANLQELRKGRPIRCTHKTHPAIPEGRTVVVMWGPTEQAIFDELRESGAIDGATVHRNPPDEPSGGMA